MGAGLASHHLHKTARSNYSCDCGREKCVARECGSVPYPKPGPRKAISAALVWECMRQEQQKFIAFVLLHRSSEAVLFWRLAGANRRLESHFGCGMLWRPPVKYRLFVLR